MTEADRKPEDPRETGAQLRPELWRTINERYPGSMIVNSAYQERSSPRRLPPVRRLPVPSGSVICAA